MPYTIRKSDGTILTTIADGSYDVTTTLSLPGKNLYNFGQLQNENYVHLLENFANTSAPVNQLTGQLWFDKSNNVLKVYTSNWQPLAVLSTNSSYSSILGNLYYDVVNQQLSINNGSGFTVIGPDGIPGYGTTRSVSTTVLDQNNVLHPVIEQYVNGELIAVISNTTFTINSGNPINGFTTLQKGINLKNYGTTNDTIINGTAQASLISNSLLGDGVGSVSAAVLSTPDTLVQRDNSGNISVSGISSNLLSGTNGLISGAWKIDTSLNPTTTNSINLGTSGLRWNNVYSQNLFGTNLTAGSIQFTTYLTDANSNNITLFDNDGTLTANATTRLPTQHAVKSYVDSSISTAIGSLSSFSQSFNNGSLGTSGWTQLPNGMIMNWGYSQVGSGSTGVAFGSVTFPKPFANHAMSAFCSTERASAPGAGASGSGYISNLSTTGMTVGFDSDGTKQSGYWFAIGF